MGAGPGEKGDLLAGARPAEGRVAVGEAPETVEDVYEPFLMVSGLIERTPRGRVATPAGFAHVGLQPSPDAPRLL